MLYSILDKHPKRAKAYWFLNVVVTDEPFTHAYIVDSFGTDFLFKVQLQLGFKVNQRVNAYLRQVINDLVTTGELPPQHHTYSIYEHRGIIGDFKFCMLRKVLAPETDISRSDHRVIYTKYAIRHLCGSPARWYGLENSSIVFEYVPMFAKMRPATRLERVSLPSDTQAERQEAEDVDIFSDDLAGENAVGRDMIADPTEQMPALDVDDDPEE